MGFFHADVEDRPKTVAKRSAGREPVDIDSLPRGCDNCSLKANWSWLQTPQMPISGNIKDADILALGEAPGEEEDKDGIAFTGASGRMLRKFIPGRDINRVAFTNTCKCHPRNNATPHYRDQHSCSVYLEEDIERLPIKGILGIGSVPLSRFYPGQAITRVHGIRFPISLAGKTIWYYPVLHPSYVLRTGDNRSPAYPILQSDIKRFFAGLDRWPSPTIWQPDATAVACPQTLPDALSIYRQMGQTIGVDIETNGLFPFAHDAKILTAAISDGKITMAFPIDHPEAPNDWGLQFLLDRVASRRWVAHNASFELAWLLAMAQRLDLSGWQPAPFDDSMACGRLYYQRETVLSLEMMTRIELGVDFKSMVKVNRHNMTAEPLDKILPYNGLDALGCLLLFKKLHKSVDADNYKRLVESVESTARMEVMGLPVDLDLSRELKFSWQTKNDQAVARSKKLYEVKQFEISRQAEFNIGSNDHVGQALVEFGRIDLPKTTKKVDGKKVEGDKWSTDDQDLRAHGGDNPLVKEVLDFRESQKQISTYIESTITWATGNHDGLIHPKYSTMLTATTRLSSDSPNIQNYPKRRHRELRRQVVPGKDHVFLSFDYGQLEARVYGCITKDRALCKSIIDKQDIHSYWRDQALRLYPPYMDRLAEKTNETEEKAILKGGRDIIKSDFVFASFFGAVAKSAAERTGMPLAITQELLASFWKRYPEANTWVKGQRQLYNDTGSVWTMCKIERHAILGGNETINTPVQGTAAHVVLEAQNALSKLSIEHKDPYLHPRVNVHDDLMFVVPDDADLIQAYVEIIGAELVKVRFDWQIVPWMVECKIGYNWADLEFVTTITGDYHK